MKKCILLSLFLSLFCGYAFSATVSGRIIDAVSGSGVSGVKVHVTDFGTVNDSVTTNTTGNYTYTLDSLVFIGDSILTYTTNCGVRLQNYYLFTGSNIVSNFTICGGIEIHGSILSAGNLITGPASVLLIRKEYDSLHSDTVLTIVDSMNTSNGNYSKYYTAIPAGTLLLKAVLLSGNTQFASYLPIYDTNSQVWNNARTLSNIHFQPSVSTNLSLIKTVNPPGTGSLSGVVQVGANKGTAIGDPISGRILILTTSAGQAVAYTFSNSSGQFSFPNLAFGTYKIYGDTWGKFNPALTITITNYKPDLSNILFEENDTYFRGSLKGVGVRGEGPSDPVLLFPNPVANELHIKGLSNLKAPISIQLYDLTGRSLIQYPYNGGDEMLLPLDQFPGGYYILELGTADEKKRYKVIK